MKLTELFEAAEKFKLYTEHPYGQGFMSVPVRKGEVLPCEDGGTATFLGITADGKKVRVHDETPEDIEEVDPKEVMGIILPASESVKGRKDFVDMSDE